MPDRESLREGRGLLALLSGGFLLVVLGVASLVVIYNQFRIEVPAAHMAIIVHKTGKDIPNSEVVAPSPEYKGIQKDVLTEGRYFVNPYYKTWRVVPQVEIPAGKVGVRVRLGGKELPAGQILALNEDERGIVPGVLLPGRYPINTSQYSIEEAEPVTIEAGYQGVVSLLSGPLADDPNQLLVDSGFRGTQRVTVKEGTHLVNPYEMRISKVDCRSQRFNVAEHKDFGFPSKDGFWVAIDAVIEFRIASERVAEVYVSYNDDSNGDQIDEEIINKVIMPNARSFCRLEGSNTLGKDFIGNRKGFQERFQQELMDACRSSGIEIVQALITKIVPPEQIAMPIQEREIAKQTEKQYQQQIIQQESERKRKIEEETVKQKQAIVQAEQSVVRVTIEAMREQEVAVTKANQDLAVAQLKLDAARDQAAATLSRGTAAADVVTFKNEAEAAGWKRSVEAFDGDGSKFAQYVLYQKMASAYRSIMVNTADSPIMKVFDSFTPADGSRTPRPTKAMAPPATKTALTQ
jgi:regulator of protease activity HflC (stomatin/prohibitin superfamily)